MTILEAQFRCASCCVCLAATCVIILSANTIVCGRQGQPSGNILQVACSERGNYFKEQYTCVQYPDLCLNSIISAWWKPAQEQYVSLYDQARGQNGGFFHQCFLGSVRHELIGRFMFSSNLSASVAVLGRVLRHNTTSHRQG